MNYDKYIILASNSKVLSGDYTGFVNFREVVEVAENISTKQIDTYLYNGEHYTLPIKLSELAHILNAIDKDLELDICRMCIWTSKERLGTFLDFLQEKIEYVAEPLQRGRSG